MLFCVATQQCRVVLKSNPVSFVCISAKISCNLLFCWEFLVVLGFCVLRRSWRAKRLVNFFCVQGVSGNLQLQLTLLVLGRKNNSCTWHGGFVERILVHVTRGSLIHMLFGWSELLFQNPDVQNLFASKTVGPLRRRGVFFISATPQLST